MRYLYNFLFILLIVFFIILNSPYLYSRSNRESLVIGIYENKPLVYTENGQPKGIYVDIIKEFVNDNNLNLKIEFYVDEFVNLLELCKKGEIDIITAIAYSKEREKFIDFSNESVIINWGELFVHKDKKELFDKNYTKSRKYTIGVVKEDIYFKEFDLLTKKLLNIEPVYVYFRDYAEVLSSLEKKIVDIGIVGRFFGFMNRALYQNIEPLSIFIRPVELKFGFRKEFDKHIIELIDDKLREIKKTNYFHNSILAKYIVPDKHIFFNSTLIKYVFYVIISLFSLLIISFIIGFILNKKVKRQTAILQNLVKEKDILIKELHHRIKNNLQIIKSMTFLQMINPISSDSSKDIEMLYNRIEYFGEFHKILYDNEGFETVKALPLFELFVKKVMNLNIALKLDIKIDDFEVDIEKAIKIGIIIGEILLFLKNNIDINTENYLSFYMKKEINEIIIIFEYSGSCDIIIDKFLNDMISSKMFQLMLKQLRDDYKVIKGDNSCSLSIKFPIN
ncbi:MAG TPA: transporter substrate-binding domain-containing protein [Spirochaetota bacterium]|nr:transporter substrate-binding domain-containing protein [Spirochaetota bacterium]